MNINLAEALHRVATFLVDRLAGNCRQIALHVVDAVVDDARPFALRLQAVDVDGHVGHRVADGLAANRHHAALDDGKGVDEGLADLQRQRRVGPGEHRLGDGTQLAGGGTGADGNGVLRVSG